MSEWDMLVWLTQLGLSVALPLTCFTWLALWLRERFSLGLWIVLAGIAVGLLCAVYGFRASLKDMESMEHRRQKLRPPSALHKNRRR